MASYSAERGNLRLVLFLAGLAVVLFTACTSAPPGSSTPTSATTPTAPRVYSFDASDYTFSTPETIEGGWVTLSVRNAGLEPHHVQVMRLNDPSQLSRVTESLKQDDLSVLREVTAPGGVGVLDSNGRGEVTLEMDEGQYLIMCFVGSPDGTPHVAKGMIKPLQVTSSSRTAEPTAEMTINMKDFSFDHADTLPAGKHTYKVVNAGPQFHEWNIMKLEEGKTIADIERFFSQPSSGPPPFQSIGGMNGMSMNETGYVTLDLQVGQYVAVCAIPDPATGKPHMELGMVRNFTVR